MQRYHCSVCRADAFGGRTVVFQGMFMKICKDCAEDNDIYHELEKRLMEETIDEQVDN